MSNLVSLATAEENSVDAGEFAGWLHVPGEAFNDHAGPFYHRHEADGSVLCGFRTAQHNSNGLGIIHGGCLLTFADYCLFVTSRAHCKPDEVVTISMNSELMGKAFAGERLEARGEVVRAGRSLIFVRGQVLGPKGVVLGFSGISKIVPRALLERGFSA
jgi:uncharacterized protein (TIGR00369 family)